ncbi:hypothetical protein [Natronoglycomyces albus]|uniref:Uncharacterized protein n=1 Tax=Natronoglycomyces albus TaxID=2811108 RepID=A0A895XJW3_9ACTN|nr:hypothetical protein [Natronoglycomyces albus]QSB03853.1 hypothetical protein JQS30_08420 [Natronoglycomyces albus]
MSWLYRNRSLMAGVGAALLATGTGSALVAAPVMAGEDREDVEASPIKSHSIDRGFVVAAAADGEGLLKSDDKSDEEDKGEDKPSKQDRLEAIADEVGFDKCQAGTALVVIETGRDMDMDDFAITIGLATVAQETNYRNLASSVVPESHEYDSCGGTGSDHDSVGIFQQRHTMGWGTVEELMDPEFQTRNFFERLDTFDYSNMALTDAAQRVQVSAHPTLYAKHEGQAKDILDAYKSA